MIDDLRAGEAALLFRLAKGPVYRGIFGWGADDFTVQMFVQTMGWASLIYRWEDRRLAALITEAGRERLRIFERDEAPRRFSEVEA